MAKANQKPTHHDVMPSVANFLSDLWFEGEFREQPEQLSEILDAILQTEIGNNPDLRIKMMNCIRTSKMLNKALKPFSDKQIEKACCRISKA